MQKKVLLILPRDSTYYQGLVRAFKYLGIEVVFFDPRKFLIFEKILAAISERPRSINSLNSRLLLLAKSSKPDFLFAMKAEMISPQTIREINALGIPTINWFPEHVNSLDLAFKLSSAYSYFFHFDPLQISELKAKGRKNIYYLPFAADLLPDDEYPDVPKTIDITFIGNHNSLREECLSCLSDLNIKIWGDQKWGNSLLAKNYQGYLPKEKIHHVLTHSKIGINIQHDYPSFGLVLRVFEVLEAGCMLLTQNKKDLTKLFDVDKDLVTFQTDLLEKTTYFLQNERERESICLSGFNRVKKKHTYVHRLKEVLNKLY